jgi:hypothetical protein
MMDASNTSTNSGSGNGQTVRTYLANPPSPPIVLDHDPTLTFALTLFDEEDDSEDDEVDVGSPCTTPNGKDATDMTDSSRDKRKHSGIYSSSNSNINTYADTGDVYRSLKTNVSKKGPIKRSRHGDADTRSTPNGGASATLDTETARARAVLEARVRELIGSHSDVTKAETAFQAATTKQKLLNAHGYNAMHYFRIMAATINGGSYSDLCYHIDRFFAAECHYKRLAVGVSSLLSHVFLLCLSTQPWQRL